jgi:hypothetical protein
VDWYSLEEAVNILSCQGVTVSKADLIRAAMDGRISLSVYINGSVKAQLAVMRSLEDAEIFFFIDPENPLESIVQNNGASYEAAYRLLTKKSLCKDQELTLSGVGREFFVSFHGIQTTKGIVAPLSYDPLYVEVSGIVSFQCDHDESHNFLARVFGSLHGVTIGCFPPSSLVATSSTGKFYIIENNPESTPSVMYPFPDGSKLGLTISQLELLYEPLNNHIQKNKMPQPKRPIEWHEDLERLFLEVLEGQQVVPSYEMMRRRIKQIRETEEDSVFTGVVTTNRARETKTDVFEVLEARTSISQKTIENKLTELRNKYRKKLNL